MWAGRRSLPAPNQLAGGPWNQSLRAAWRRCDCTPLGYHLFPSHGKIYFPRDSRYLLVRPISGTTSAGKLCRQDPNIA
ncbi:hypothetical protein RRG08_039187 [Elysia crispata]|uniref:Uncharacterized protein n=1 Tax=Elysia crispata TaxID=231223 RepID=A0AAE1DEA1_9GAST|nr:hypothetical protein RRG08_039187 [Elysia crispata]